MMQTMDTIQGKLINQKYIERFKGILKKKTNKKKNIKLI